MRTPKHTPPRSQLLPCHPLTRVHYTTGQMLSVDDFTAEQTYVREKLRRHNRTLHHPGVVVGLEVTLESSGVRVAPDFALDAVGNEICVPVAQGAALPATPEEVYLVLWHKEIAVNPVPVLGLSGEATPAVVLSRI